MTGIKVLLKIVCDRHWPGDPSAVPKIQVVGKCQRILIGRGQSSRSEPVAIEQDEQRFPSIVVLGKLWDTEFSAEFFRGVHAQADELGIVINDQRTDERTYVEAEGDEAESRLLARVEELKLNSQAESLMVYMDDVDIIDRHCKELRQEGFWVVTIGYRRATITEDGELLGEMVARHCLAAEEVAQAIGQGGRRPRLVIVATFGGRADFHYRSRKDGLESVLSRRGDLVRIVPLKLAGLDLSNREAAAVVTERLDRLIQAEGGKEVVAAIFPRTPPLMKVALDWIAANEAEIDVYGERLLTSDFALLRRESRVAALCGVDPYHYGRYAVRAASCRWVRPLPEASPVLVTKKEAQNRKLNAVSRLPAILNGSDVRLDDERYAWAIWMKPCSRENYGPDRFVKASPQPLPPRP